MIQCMHDGFNSVGKCSVLKPEEHERFLRKGYCGTEKCPFYKTEEQQIEQELACRARLKDKGWRYFGILTRRT